MGKYPYWRHKDTKKSQSHTLKIVAAGNTSNPIKKRDTSGKRTDCHRYHEK